MPNSAIKFLLDLIFPLFCQSCGAEGGYLCLPCQTKITEPVHRCFACGKNSLLGSVHEKCRGRSVALSGLMVVGEYENHGLQNLIWNLKYNSVKDISDIIALLMTDFFVKNNLTEYFADSVIVPVPMHKHRQRFRGFNQAETIAQAFGQRIGWDCYPALQKIKNTKQQAKLQRTERIENVRGAFALKDHVRPLKSKKIIIIDDVATTGATLNECALILRQLDPSEIWGLVAARN